MEWSVEEEIAQVEVTRPHVVLIGAGASRAAFPDGDKNGMKLPLMADFQDIVPIRQIMSDAGIHETNLEKAYSELASREDLSEQSELVEKVIFNYFAGLKLPEESTLYDHLILGLRPKDVIATFNWDPFLIQAALRNRHVTDIPKLMFLHGNVAQGFCRTDSKHGTLGAICSTCRGSLDPVKLLYPLAEKNYESDPAINSAWRGIRSALASAFMVTVFGYSAPDSDQSAVKLLREAWGGWTKRKLEQFEFIDISEESKFIKSWSDFVNPGHHHYDVHTDFYNSWIARHPRRTGEAWWNQYLEAMFLENNMIPRDPSLAGTWEWYKPLIDAEKCVAKRALQGHS